jgi:hypothetical protein
MRHSLKDKWSLSKLEGWVFNKIPAFLLAVSIVLFALTFFGIIFILLENIRSFFCLTSFCYFDFLKSFLPVKSVFSALIATISVFFILKQTGILLNTQRQTQLTLEENLKESAIDASNRFASIVMPKTIDLFEELGRSAVNFTDEWDTSEFTYSSLIAQKPSWSFPFTSKAVKEQLTLWEILFEVNSLSVKILGNPHKETTAFRMIGRDFLLIVRKLYPYISFVRDSNQSADWESRFKAIIELYKSWEKNDRI